MPDNAGTSAAATPAGVKAPNAKMSAAEAAAAEGNPVFRMMGLPRIRARLPSRNWLIFLSITGSWTAAVLYDRQQKKRIQQKWCDLVAPVAEEILPPDTMPRRVTIYLQAPPGDGLRAAREHFYEYVKPVLVAAAMDWDVVEGRREGDVRYGTAERVRRFRRKAGEGAGLVETGDEKEDKKLAVEQARARAGTAEYEGVGGDLVVGRHAWKEYLRGLHEGWLGPVEKPEEIKPELEQTGVVESSPVDAKIHTDGHSSLGDAAVTAAANLTQPTSDAQQSTPDQQTLPGDNSPQSPQSNEEPKPAEAEPETPKPKTNTKPDPYIPISSYSSASLPSSFPDALGPTTILPFPHILGFVNTPIRIYRFLNQRQLADDIGRRTAAAVMASYRSFDDRQSMNSSSSDSDTTSSFSPEGGESLSGSTNSSTWEQAKLLSQEEQEWHKTVRKRERVEGVESVWLDQVVLDGRIAERMRVFELGAAEEEEARRLAITPRERAGWKEWMGGLVGMSGGDSKGVVGETIGGTDEKE